MGNPGGTQTATTSSAAAERGGREETTSSAATEGGGRKEATSSAATERGGTETATTSSSSATATEPAVVGLHHKHLWNRKHPRSSVRGSRRKWISIWIRKVDGSLILAKPDSTDSTL